MWNQLDWYRKMMLGMIPISFSLLLFLLFGHSGDFLFSEWFLNLIAIPSFIGGQTATAGYLGRSLDAFSSKTPLGKAERMGTFIGLGLGLALGIALTVVTTVIPLAKPLGVIAEVLFAVGSVTGFAGLGNRIGQCIDNNNRLLNEKRAISTAVTIGVVLGIVLLAAKCAALVSIVGVTSFLSGGAALPLWIAGAVFVTSFSSSLASTADYVSKSVNYLKHTSTTDKKTQNVVKNRFHEYRGAFAGVSTGLIVAGIIIGALAISQPYLFAGIVGVVAAFMVVSACVAVLGGLFSRVGRLIDTRKLLKEAEPNHYEPVLTQRQRKCSSAKVQQKLIEKTVVSAPIEKNEASESEDVVCQSPPSSVPSMLLSSPPSPSLWRARIEEVPAEDFLRNVQPSILVAT